MGLLDLHRRGRVVLGLDAGDGFTAFNVVDSLGKGVLNAFVPGVGDTVSTYTNKAADWGKQKYDPALYQREQAQRAAKAQQAAAEARVKAGAQPSAQPGAKTYAAHRGPTSPHSPPWVEPVVVSGAIAVVVGLALTLTRRRP